MTPFRMPRRTIRVLAPALLLAATASGCGLLPIDPNGADEPTAPEPEPAATGPQAAAQSSTPDTQAAPATGSETETEEPANPLVEPHHELQIARTDTAERERQDALRTDGHEALEPERLGYYMDVLGARLRQELAGQAVAIDHRDPDIHVHISAHAGSEDHEQALDTIGRVLDEFRASLITVIAHRQPRDASEGNTQRSEDDARAAGRRLEQTGVASERLVLRVNAPEARVDGTDATAPTRMELRIQPLAAS